MVESRKLGDDYKSSAPPLVFSSSKGDLCLWIDIEAHEPLGAKVDISNVQDSGTIVPSPRNFLNLVRSAGASGRTVLLVDDAHSAREPARQALESAGYEVLEAESGNQALLLLESEPEIGLVFLRPPYARWHRNGDGPGNKK